MEEKIVTILNEMAEYLTVPQMKKLQEVILRTFSENELEKHQISNEEFLEMFLDAKRVEGCSERSMEYIELFYMVGGRRLHFKKSNEKDS